MSKIALITGVTGQDGSYLAELLLTKGYKVHAIIRPKSLEKKIEKFWRIKRILSDIEFHNGNLESYSDIFRIVNKIKPNEIYHLAAQAYDGYSFDNAFYTFRINIETTHGILSSIKNLSVKTKLFFSASSEMFNKNSKESLNEESIFNPLSAYGISKVIGYHLVKNYRDAYKLHASNGILFNHESPRRGFEFVTRKISHAVARIKKGSKEKLKLGNIQAKRDWGHAKDYVEAMWLILQQENSDDYVIGTGKEHSVEEFAKKAFDHVGLNYKDHIVIDKNLIRPAEVDTLLADYSKANKILGWKPKISFDDLVKNMVDNDLNLAD